MKFIQWYLKIPLLQVQIVLLMQEYNSVYLLLGTRGGTVTWLRHRVYSKTLGTMDIVVKECRKSDCEGDGRI